jgi:molecular chaperone DnaK (HSP70)
MIANVKQPKMLAVLLVLEVKRIINEPTAAALAFGLSSKKSGA